MAYVEIHVEYLRCLKDYEDIMNQLRPTIGDGLRKGAEVIVSAAQDKAGAELSHAGGYNRHFNVHVTEDLRVFISNDHIAAGFLEDGTTAHEIVAHGRALKFIQQGQEVFYRRVMHPGTIAYKFMTRAAEQFKDAVAHEVVQVLDTLFRR